MSEHHSPLATRHSATDRYARQTAFAPFGPDGQRRLSLTSAVLIGCGALGSASADLLVRAGVGSLRIIDRDFVEITNLQRQTLFDEADIADNLPKAEAAARKLRKINSAVELEAVVTDVNAGNIESFVRDADLMLDGLDNFETRYLLNDAAVKLDLPWVYAACVAAGGLSMPILPGQTPCLRCLWPEPPAAGSVETCDSAGVLGPAVTAVASVQAMTAIKLLSGKLTPADQILTSIDVWRGRLHRTNVMPAFAPGACRCCGQHEFDFLSGRGESAATVLCGRNAVQVSPPPGDRPPLEFGRLARGLPSRANATHNRFMLRFDAENCEVAVFPDGRAIVTGTSDAAVARRIYAQHIGT